MSQQSYWKGDGKDAVLGKAVVSPTGHVIARNYDPKTLHEGDLGLSVRVDRKFEEMTPEQRMAAAGVVDELAALLKQGVGAETDLGFTPGMVVRATSGKNEVNGLVERITPFSVLLRVVGALGVLILKQLPLGVWALEERKGFNGLEGLLIRFCLEVDKNDNEVDCGDFDNSVFVHVTSEAGIKRCFETETDGSGIGRCWMAKHLPNEELRKWVLMEQGFGEDVLPTVENPETIIAWFQSQKWSDKERNAKQCEPDVVIALDRLKELKASDEQFLSTISAEQPNAVLRQAVRYLNDPASLLGLLRVVDADILISRLIELDGEPTREHARRVIEAVEGRPEQIKLLVEKADFSVEELKSAIVLSNYWELDAYERLTAAEMVAEMVQGLFEGTGATVEQLTNMIVREMVPWRNAALAHLIRHHRSEADLPGLFSRLLPTVRTSQEYVNCGWYCLSARPEDSSRSGCEYFQTFEGGHIIHKVLEGISDIETLEALVKMYTNQYNGPYSHQAARFHIHSRLGILKYKAAEAAKKSG